MRLQPTPISTNKKGKRKLCDANMWLELVASVVLWVASRLVWQVSQYLGVCLEFDE